VGIRDWIVSTIVFVAICAAALASTALRRTRAAWRPMLAASTFAIAVATTMFGPLVFAPALAVMNTLFFVIQMGRGRLVPLIAIGCAPVVVPICLQWLGLLPASYRFADGTMQIAPWMHHLWAPATPLFLVAASVSMIALAAVLASRYRENLAAAELRLQVQAWHLRNLVPQAPDR
jgi:serine/threonine-protein kinase